MRYDIPSFRVDRADFLKGNNLYDDYPDGGFLNASIGMNIFNKPGLMQASAPLGSGVTGSLPSLGVISWGDQNASSPPIAVLADGSGHGYYATMDNSGNLTIVGAADTTNTYVPGITDTVLFQNQFYTTTTTDIVYNADGVGLASISRNLSWWTVTKGKSALTNGVPHPMIVLGSVLYIADFDFLHSWDGTTAQTNVFDTGGQQVITALIIYNGYMYIATEPYFSLAGNMHGKGRIVTWNGFSPGWTSEILVDYRINALFVYKNILYMFNPYNISYFFRNRFHVVHPLSNQVLKHQITTVADSMMYVDGHYVWRYGSPFAETIAQEKWYRYFVSAGAALSGIKGWYQNSMMVVEVGGSNAINYFISNVNTPTSASTVTIDFNPKFFPYPVRLRGIQIDGAPLTSSQRLQVEWTDSKGNVVTTPADFNGSTPSLVGLRQKRFDINGKGATKVIQPRIIINGDYALRYIDFLYERSEDQLSS